MAKTKQVKDAQDTIIEPTNTSENTTYTPVIQPYRRNRIIVKKYQPIPRFKSGCKNC